VTVALSFEKGGWKAQASQTEYESRQPIKAATPSYPKQHYRPNLSQLLFPLPAVPEATTTTPLAALETAATTTATRTRQ